MRRATIPWVSASCDQSLRKSFNLLLSNELLFFLMAKRFVSVAFQRVTLPYWRPEHVFKLFIVKWPARPLCARQPVSHHCILIQQIAHAVPSAWLYYILLCIYGRLVYYVRTVTSEKVWPSVFLLMRQYKWYGPIYSSGRSGLYLAPTVPTFSLW